MMTAAKLMEELRVLSGRTPGNFAVFQDETNGGEFWA